MKGNEEHIFCPTEKPTPTKCFPSFPWELKIFKRGQACSASWVAFTKGVCTGYWDSILTLLSSPLLQKHFWKHREILQQGRNGGSGSTLFQPTVVTVLANDFATNKNADTEHSIHWPVITLLCSHRGVIHLHHNSVLLDNRACRWESQKQEGRFLIALSLWNSFSSMNISLLTGCPAGPRDISF